MGLQLEHLSILHAISTGDAEAARDAMRIHLTRSQERYRDRLQKRQAYYARELEASKRG
jgi:GntR family transcriptional regulator, transcriptional repressor for pyruvate dehydrogenase complex